MGAESPCCPFSPPLPHSLAVVVLKRGGGGGEGTFNFFLPRLKAHFFPSSSPSGVREGWSSGPRVCHDTDGLYFDYGALVVMGDGRRGGATLRMCLYKSCTQTPKSLVIPWPKLIQALTNIDQLCSQLWTAQTGIPPQKRLKGILKLLDLLLLLNFLKYFFPRFDHQHYLHSCPWQEAAEDWRTVFIFCILFMFFLRLVELFLEI